VCVFDGGKSDVTSWKCVSESTRKMTHTQPEETLGNRLRDKMTFCDICKTAYLIALLLPTTLTPMKPFRSVLRPSFILAGSDIAY
jgi:hypothetical protein